MSESGKLRAIDEVHQDEPVTEPKEPYAQRVRHLRKPGARREDLEPDRPSDVVRIGLDVGKSSDPTSAAVVQPIEFATGRIRCGMAHDDLSAHAPDHCWPEMKWKFALRALNTLPLGMDYPEQVRRVLGDIAYPLLDRPGIRRVGLFVDATGIGRGVVDGLDEYLRADGMADRIHVAAVTITAGDPNLYEPGHRSVKVSKAHLMTRLQSVVGMGYLEWNRDKLREAAALADEIRTMEVVFPDAYGQTTVKYQASGRAHDDRVLALALAVLNRPWGRIESAPSIWA
jgi:hypothetical protein